MARKRKVGRPKGSKNKKRKVGRPKGSKKATKKVSRKRKVGRPKGSKTTKKTAKKRGRKKLGLTLDALKKMSLEQVAKIQQKVYATLKSKQAKPSGKKRGRPRKVTMVSSIPDTLRMGAFDIEPATTRMKSRSTYDKRLAALAKARAVRKAKARGRALLAASGGIL